MIDYIKPKYQTTKNYATWIQMALLFILKLFYKDFPDDVKKRFDKSTYEVSRPLLTGLD